jgi:hypothetical protein
MIPNNFVWPSREEWAKQERTPYGDKFPDNLVTSHASAYATPAEIQSAIKALRQLYADEGRKLRAAKVNAGTLARQKDETGIAYAKRYFDGMSQDERDAVLPIGNHEISRKLINEALKALTDDIVAGHGGLDDMKAILAPILGRYEAALDAAYEARRKEIEATPIDDAAWEKELRRRVGVGRQSKPYGGRHG